MSVEYDDKIVRMQFDNKSFESGVQTTIKSLQNLKDSLNFNNAVSGIENLTAGFQNISFNNLLTGIDQVTVKIPVIGTVLDQTIRNMTNSVEGFVKDTLSKFSNIGNAKSGFGEYELQIGAVKTIKASTGEDVATINKYLEELNKYADDTIYSFSDMTRNIGKFTNAGVKLEDAVSAIKGISNEAALAGASSEEASRAMYNFSQALSAGSVKLIDWKSIENANMATVGFKDELIKTALELGTLRQEGDKYISTTTDMQGKVSDAFNSTTAFNESLSAQWMTTDVLVETLKRYTDETTGIGKAATEAATKVNTFTQAIGAIVEDLGSNWTESWKYIIGDFEEATEMWTKFKDAVSGFFKPAADARNEMLKFWSQNRSGSEETVEVTEEATEKYKELFDVAHAGWMGDYGVGEERIKALTEAGYDYAEVQGIIDKMVAGEVKSWEDVAEIQRQAAKQANEQAAIEAGQMSGREMFLKGISNLWETYSGIINTIRGAWKEVFPPMTGQRLVELSKAFMELTEKMIPSEETLDNIRRTFRGIFSVLSIGMTVVKAVVKGFGAMFKAISEAQGEKSGGGILGIGAAIGDLLFKFDQLLKETGILETVFTTVGKVIGIVIGTILDGIGSIIDAIIDLASAFKDFIGENIDLDGMVTPFEDADDDISNVAVNIATTIANFAKIPLDGIATLISNIKNAFGPLSKVGDFLSKVGDFFKAGWEKIKSVFSTIAQILSPVVDLVKDKVVELTGAMSFDDLVDKLKKGGILVILGQFIAFMHNMNKDSKKFGKLLDGFGEMMDVIKEKSEALAAAVKAKAIFTIALSIALLAGTVIMLGMFSWDTIIRGLSAFGTILVELEKALNSLNIKDLTKVARVLIALGLSMIFIATAVKMLGAMSFEDAVLGVGMLGLILGELVIAVNNVTSSGNLDKVSRTLIALSTAIFLLIVPIIALAFLPEDEIRHGLLMLAIVLAELTATVDTMKVDGNLDKVSRTLLSLAVAITLLMVPLLLLAFLPEEQINRGVGMLALVLGEVVAALDFSKLGTVKDGTTKLLWAIVAAIIVVTIVINNLGSMDMKTLAQGYIAAVLVAGLLAALMRMLGKVNLGGYKEAKNMIKVLEAVVAALLVMTGIVAYIADMGLKDAAVGIGGLTAIYALLIGSIYLMAKAFQNPEFSKGAEAFGDVLLSIGAAFFLFGAGVLAFVEAMKLLNDTDFDGDLLEKFALISAIVPIFVSEFIGGLIGGIIGAVPAVIDGMLTAINLIIEHLAENIGDLVDNLMTIILGILGGIADASYEITEKIFEILDGVFLAIHDNQDKIVEWAAILTETVASIINGIASNIDLVIDAAINLVKAILSGVWGRAKEFHESAVDVAIKIIGEVVEAIKGFATKLKKLGKFVLGWIVKGMIMGINAAIQGIMDLIAGVVNAVIEAANNLPLVDLNTWDPEWDPIKVPETVENWTHALAKGGRPDFGSAIVGEAGPELLSQVAGKTQVTPLTNQYAKQGTLDVFGEMLNQERMIAARAENISNGLNAQNKLIVESTYDDSKLMERVNSMEKSITILGKEITNIGVYLDGKALVGQIVGPMDEALGARAIRRRK